MSEPTAKMKKLLRLPMASLKYALTM